jgi:hypothetical protein
MHPEMVGTTSYYSPADNFRRVYHVWAVYDPLTRELESIYINNSSDLISAAGPLLRKHCELPHQLQAWSFAEQSLAAGLITDENDEVDDDAVIEPFESTVVPFGAHRGH